MKKFRLNAFAGSNCGRQEKNNNSFYFDSFYPEIDQIQYPILVKSSGTSKKLELFGVFDCCGSPEHSCDAAYTAASQLKFSHDELYRQDAPYWDGIFNDYAKKVDEKFNSLREQYKCRLGIGTAILGYDGKNIRIYNSGSCSVYMLRDGKLSRLTSGRYYHNDTASAESDDAANKPESIEMLSPLSCISKFEARKNDTFLLCTNGIDSVLSQKNIKSILSQSRANEELVNRLIKSAIDKGSDNNLTAVVIKVEPDRSASYLSGHGNALVSWLITAIIVLSLLFTAFGMYLYGKTYDNDFPPYAMFFNKSSEDAADSTDI